MFKRRPYRMFQSLQSKIFIFTLLIVLIPLVVLGVFSYIKSSETVQQKMIESDLNTVTQISHNINLMEDYVESTSLFLIQNQTVRHFLLLPSSASKQKENKKREEAEILLTQLLTQKKYIDSVYLKGFNGLSLDTKGSQKPLNRRTRTKLMKLDGGYMWTPGEIKNFNGQKTKVLSHLRIIRDVNHVSRNLGILKINLDMNAIKQLFLHNQQMKQGQFFLVNHNNRVIASSKDSAIGSQLSKKIKENKHFKTSNRGYYQDTLNGKQYEVIYDQVGARGWKIAYQVPVKELFKERSFIPLTLAIIVIFSFVICVGFAFIFSRRVVQPLKKMALLMNQVEHENFNGKIEVRGNDEIAQLGQSFNNMSQRLKELINEVYTTKIKQKEAQLKALQTQINPHFLYNTLDMIYWMARMEKAFETSKLVVALSKLFRLSLNSGKGMTTVEDELSHLRHYMIIQQKRYEDMMDFQLKVDENVFHAQTVKMVLQPLVENAIVHGLGEKEGIGRILVTISCEGDNLLFQITDNGSGVDPKEMKQLLKEPVQKQNRGFGIKNVNDRIQLYFGEPYGISFISQDGEGTTVLVKQPWKEVGYS